jgi:uncharacterized protein
MATIQTPGVYIEEIPLLPPSVASVDTAIPAFIGYTQKAQLQVAGDLLFLPKKINSLLEYEQYFGLPFLETAITVSLDITIPGNIQAVASIKKPSPYKIYYGLQLFFANGGGPCYIVSVGGYAATPAIKAADLKKGLLAIAVVNELTLICFPDALHVSTAAAYYGIFKKAMLQCAELKDRFTIMDVWINSKPAIDNIQVLRNFNFGETEILKYAAAYYPRIYTVLNYAYEEISVRIKATGDKSLSGTLAQLQSTNNACYLLAKKAIEDMLLLLPVSPAVAGVYAQVDNARGVWKAPANINIALAEKPFVAITDGEQEGLNIDAVGGKSINAIRSFAGRGAAIIWGARTLAGNDNEWRYIPVRRFFMMVEESVKNATAPFSFEPNDAATWVRVKGMVENYCVQQWRAGALMGNTPNNAFFVHVGLSETMTAQDILEGRMIVEIGLAVVRPAEFIILRFMQKMPPE